MSVNNLSAYASRLRVLGRELFAIANQLDAQAPHLGVNLPRDLFSEIEEPQPQLFEGINASTEDTTQEQQVEPARRTYVRNGKRMVEHLAVTSAERVGKAQGFCARNDIERTIVRITGRNREDVREAVNRVATRMQITCVKSRSYRYYPRSLRGTIVNTACEELERI